MALLTLRETEELRRKGIRELNMPVLAPARRFGDADTLSFENDYVTYDVQTMTYKTYSQEKKIRELEGQIKEADSDKSNKLQSLIAYYYKKR